MTTTSNPNADHSILEKKLTDEDKMQIRMDISNIVLRKLGFKTDLSEFNTIMDVPILAHRLSRLDVVDDMPDKLHELMVRMVLGK